MTEQEQRRIDAQLDEQPKWKLTAKLYWRWLVGGPNLIRALGGEVLAAVRKRAEEEKSARNDRREIFKNWSLITAAEDGTIIRIRPGTMTVHLQGPITPAVYERLKEAWMESALLIRFEFPLTQLSPHSYITNGDWKIATLAPNLQPVEFKSEPGAQA